MISEPHQILGGSMKFEPHQNIFLGGSMISEPDQKYWGAQ